jgi:hypothetical protein
VEGEGGGGKSEVAPTGGGGEFSLNDPETATTSSSSSSSSTSLFAYTSTWAREAGLSTSAAERAYAKGEDIDVWEARAEVERVWEEGIEEEKGQDQDQEQEQEQEQVPKAMVRPMRQTYLLQDYHLSS